MMGSQQKCKLLSALRTAIVNGANRKCWINFQIRFFTLTPHNSVLIIENHEAPSRQPCSCLLVP